MKKNNSLKSMSIAAVLGGVGVAGYMYMKNNPQIMHNAKVMMKNMERKKFEKLDQQV